jgi:glycogen(starch) synthase
MKILHVLYQSLPHLQGTSIRSRDILLSQKKAGLEVIVATSPFQKPFDIVLSNAVEYYQGIPHYRTYNNEGINFTEGISSFKNKLKKLTYFLPFTCQLYKITKKEKPDVLHAHATFFTAFAAKICSALLHIPFVYEVRSLWDERQKQLSKTRWQLFQVLLIKRMEQFAFNLADEIVVINKNLEEELRKRGVKKRISVITNAVNLNTINTHETNHNPFSKEKIVFAYIGSLTFLEGLPFLIRQFSKLKNKPVELLIFGNGPIKGELEKIISKEQITNVFIKDGFEPEAIFSVYNQVDCIINPRIKNLLSDSVTPLKPLEAMAHGKLFIGSDVGGMKELITHNINGLLFKAEDEKSFADTIDFVLSPANNEKIEHLIENGIKTVSERYNWDINALKYLEIYKRVTA